MSNKKFINKIRVLAGLDVVERDIPAPGEQMEEAAPELLESGAKGYVYPRKRNELDPPTPENYAKRAKCVENVIKHLDAALSELGKCPKLDWMGDLAALSGEIDGLVNGEGGEGGYKRMVKYYKDQAAKSKKTGGKVSV